LERILHANFLPFFYWRKLIPTPRMANLGRAEKALAAGIDADFLASFSDFLR
jgi:hypothetical protein